jgi:outer membrane protein assembly factor BamB
MVWDFKTGTDLDGSSVVGDDGVILQAVEKEYTKLHGGVMALDPSKPPASAPLWYYPTEDRGISEWKGGVVGSVAVNDESNSDGKHPRLAAFVSVDGYLRVIARDALTSQTTKAPGAAGKLPVPKLVYRDNIGAGISTPIIVGDTLIAAGYDRTVHLYRMTYRQASADAAGALQSPSGAFWTVKISERDTFKAAGPFESTAMVWGGRVYLGCRDGYLYCLGSR